LVSGAGYIYLTTEGLIGERVLGFVKKVGLIYMVPILLLLLVMGLNNHETSIFAGDLYQANWLFYIFPALLIIAAVSTMIFGYKEDGFKVFVSSVLVMVLFVATGFVGMFPNVLISLDNPLESLTIEDVMAQTASLRIIVIAIAVFYPIIIGYQSWKFVKFRHKIKLNDE
jgi:cytochrome d ubiquinol oxidase subunit II